MRLTQPTFRRFKPHLPKWFIFRSPRNSVTKSTWESKFFFLFYAEENTLESFSIHLEGLRRDKHIVESREFQPMKKNSVKSFFLLKTKN